MAAQQAEARARIQKVYQEVGAPCLSAAEFTLTKVFIDYRAWDAIPDQGDIAVSELAEKISGTHEVVDRITAFLVARKVLDSPAPGRVAHTEKSRGYKSGQPTAWMWIHMFNNVFRSFAQLPAFFAQHGLASPDSVNFTPLGLAHGHEDKAAYDIIVSDKDVHKGFNEALREVGEMYSLKGIYDFGWLQETLAAGSRFAVVDVGGSHGLALRDIVRSYSFISVERCAVYDLPQVVENTRKNLDQNPDDLQKVQLVGGSMFEPYPESVRGACVYQFRRVLNDFPDQDVIRALKSVRKAVAPDSRVLIIEDMLNPKRIALNVGIDIALMMAAGKRRNAAMYSELAEQAGFRLAAEFQNNNSDFDDFGVLEFVVA
ncbi:putative O-methyltransferase [Mollisia scopiformis]|uniref:Putative O-methyltransferase n=1 Tax=Mollisia scopiformis TaxID=149040 RepID=A0A194XPW3_MOLSC|nr:putative O-methyltransferase [Mollisia scopiformis]KUJ22233.1 putative O-methyltransferase [Mollisia scopiformis]